MAAFLSMMINICLRKFFNFLGYMGGAFVVLGFIHPSAISTELYEILSLGSSFLTLAGVILTAASIYRHAEPKPPDIFSKAISAPATIIFALLAIYIIIKSHSLDPMVVNGFALLGLAGGLFRTQRKPNAE